MNWLAVLGFLAGCVLIAEEESDDLLALLLKVRLSMERFDEERTHEYLTRAECLAPESAEVRFLKVKWLIRQAQRHGSIDSWDQVRTLLTTAMGDFPGDYRFPKELGVLLVRESVFGLNTELSPAESYLLLALELIDPKDVSLGHERAEAYFCLGQTQMAKKQFFDAALAFRHVCMLVPDMAWAWYHAAQAYEYSWQFRSALDHYRSFQEQLRFIPPQTTRSLVTSICLLETILEPTQAHVQNLWDVLNVFSNRPTAVEEAVAQLCHLGRFEAALQLMELLESSDEFPSRLIFREFQCLMALGHYGKASTRLMSFLPTAKDVQLRRQYAEFALEAALMAQKPNLVSRMLKDIGPLLDESPRGVLLKAAFSVLTHHDRQPWIQALGRFQQAPLIINYKAHSRHLGVDGAAHLLLARLYLANRDFGRAVQRFRRLDWTNIDDVSLMLELADTLALDGRMEEAFARYEQLLTRDPLQTSALNNLGYFLARENRNLDRARQLIEKSLSLDPSCSACLDSLGWVHFKSGEFTRAKELLTKAIELVPDDSEKLEHLGDILAAQGKHQEAKRAYSQAIGLFDGRSGHFDRLLGKLDPP